jgi:hypothetical protein
MAESAILLCAVPTGLTVQKHGLVRYVFEASGLTLPLYFALKGKHGFILTNASELVAGLQPLLQKVAMNFDVIICPQSRYPFVSQLASGLPHVLELKKREKREVCEFAGATARWSRAERLSQEKTWAAMGETFIMNAIKSNQRRHYIPHLFAPVQLDQTARVLLLDDFIMSGDTLAAMQAALHRDKCDAFSVFYQPNYRRP